MLIYLGLLWMEQHIKVTNRIAAAMMVSGGISAIVFPAITGQFITKYPMILMYLTFGTLVLCFIVFVCAIFVGTKLNKETCNNNGLKNPGFEMSEVTICTESSHCEA